MSEMVATCERCGVLVDLVDAHDRFHVDVATMAASVLKVLDRGQQQNRLSLAANLTIAGASRGASQVQNARGYL